MKITQDTPSRMSIFSRRKILADLIFLFFLTLGALVTAAMARENMVEMLNLFALCLSLLFVGIGIWGLLHNASDQVVLDAEARTLTITRRRLLNHCTEVIPFSDLTDVRVHEDDGMHTMAFAVRDRDDVLLETTYSNNPKAADLVESVRDWLGARA